MFVRLYSFCLVSFEAIIFEGVARVSQGCLFDVSRMFKGSFKDVNRKFQGFFKEF